MHFESLISAMKARRTTLRITQEDLAQISGVALRTIKEFERGSGNPTLLTLQKLADTLGYELTMTLKKPKQ